MSLFGFGADDDEDKDNLLADNSTTPSDQSSGDAPPAMNPTVKDYLTQKYDLNKYSPEARQQIINQNKEDASGPNIAAGLAAFGAGLQGQSAGYAANTVLKNQAQASKNQLNQFDTARNQTMQDLTFAQGQEKLKNETDPDSKESKIAQDLAKSMGMDPDLAENLTAAKFKEMSPVLEKKYQVELNNQTRADNAKIAAQARSDALKAKGEAASDKNLAQLKDDLDPNKARGGNLAKNQAQLDQADRLKGLYTEANGDIRNLDSRQMEELAIGMNRMLSGSANGSTTQVQALLPKTIVGNAAKLKEWLMNDPQGTDQKAFVQRMAETIERERGIADAQVKTAQVSRLSAYEKLKKSNPDGYAHVLSSYGISPDDIDDNGRYKPQKMGRNNPVATGGGATGDFGAPQRKVVNGVPYKKVEGGWAPDQTATASEQ